MERSSPSSSILFLSLSVLVLLCSTEANEAVVKLPGNNTVPAVIVFGDSIVDTGNNNYYITVSKCNYSPYGRDFEGGVPTGRFSNGKVPSDLFAEGLGVKDLLPPYFDPNLQPKDFVTGVNFASGGAGYDPLTSTIEQAISLEGQLKLFKEYTQKLKEIVGEEGTNTILTKGIFLVVTSSNDIVNTYFNARIRQLGNNIYSYSDFLVSKASTFIKELYGHGIRKIGVLGAPPLGCLPSSITIRGGGNRKECVEEYNQASQLFNAKLSAQIDSLNSNLPNARIVYVDIYEPLLDIIKNPEIYGFEVVDRGCCGTGKLEVTFLCNPSTPLCRDISSYVFFDSFHPTERVYRIIVSEALKKYVNHFF